MPGFWPCELGCAMLRAKVYSSQRFEELQPAVGTVRAVLPSYTGALGLPAHQR